MRPIRLPAAAALAAVALAVVGTATAALPASTPTATSPTTPATTPAVTTPTTPVATPVVTPSPSPSPSPTPSPTPKPNHDDDAPTTSDPWSLPDRVVDRLDDSWQKSRQLYLDRGGVSIRSNAMLLQLHALAALAGHTGAAREDARIPGLVRLFTTAPVYVTVTHIRRSTGNFPHTPAFESVYRADSAQAPLHPSADAIIAQALATAWRARDLIGLPPEDVQRIQQVIGGVAHGSWYRGNSRAENQINWNADVYQADLEVNNDRSLLPDYRSHLAWFIDHANRPAYKGGSSNLSRGDGFRYLPEDKGGSANSIETVEYANLVHSALGFYDTAVQAGMTPLNSTQVKAYKAWSRHLLFGTWTHSGYPNWDSGLGSARRHIRQYWAFALESLIRSSAQGGMLGTADQRQYVRDIADSALLLFRQTAWDGTGPFPKATQFDAPNGFVAGTHSPLITPLRFALVAAQMDVRLPGIKPVAMGNVYSHDSEFGRLAISTPAYNLAIVKPVTQGEGGLEPTRLFDSRQRPLTELGAGGFGGPTPSLRLLRRGSTVLDDQPGTQRSGAVPGMTVSSSRKNNAGTFRELTAHATIRAGKASITVQHRFTTAAIETKYRISHGTATTVVMRLPVWGTDSTIEIMHGAVGSGTGFRRTSGALLVRGTTSDGAVMLVAYRGIPTAATFAISTDQPTGRAPHGARELRIRFAARNGVAIKRRIAVVADAPSR